MLFAVPHGARRGWRRRVAFGGSRSALVVLTFYVLRSPFYVRRSTFYVLRSTFYVLRSTFYVLRSTFYVLRSTFYVLRSTFYVLRSTVRRSPFYVRRSACHAGRVRTARMATAPPLSTQQPSGLSLGSRPPASAIRLPTLSQGRAHRSTA